MLEEDVLVGQSRRRKERTVERSQADLGAAVRDTNLACHMASGTTHTHTHTHTRHLYGIYIGPTAPSSASSKLMTAVNTLKETCSRTVSVSNNAHTNTNTAHTFEREGNETTNCYTCW